MKKKLARIISEIMNGFATMLLPMVITILISDVSLKTKLLLSSYYLLAGILPYIILRNFKKVSDYEFTDRKERPPYFIILTVLFLIGYIFAKSTGNIQIENVAYAQILITFVFTVVTFFWKISGHLTYGTFFLCTLIYLFPETNNLIYILFLIPPLSWSRVALEKHTYLQTFAGTFLSLLFSFLIFQIL